MRIEKGRINEMKSFDELLESLHDCEMMARRARHNVFNGARPVNMSNPDEVKDAQLRYARHDAAIDAYSDAYHKGVALRNAIREHLNALL